MFKVVKKTEVTAGKKALINIAGILLALATVALFLLAAGLNPFDVYTEMIKGSFGTP